MKVLMKPIKMIAWFEENGKLMPIRYQLENSESEKISVNVDKVLLMQEEKLAGNKMFIYKCQSVLNGLERIYELKYELYTCKWFLYKM